MWRDDKREAEAALVGEANPVNMVAVEAGEERPRRVLAEVEATCRVRLPQVAAMFFQLHRNQNYCRIPRRKDSALGLALSSKRSATYWATTAMLGLFLLLLMMIQPCLFWAFSGLK